MDLVLQTDKESLSARFSLSAFVTDWEAARKAFIASVAETFREPLNPRPEDFSAAFPTELAEAWCKYRIFGGSSTIVLRADSLEINFANIVRPDYAIVAEVLRRSADELLPALGSYVEHSYHVSTNQHAAVINGSSEQYLAHHASANVEIPEPKWAVEFRPCIGFTLRTGDGYRVFRRTIEQSELLENGLFIADYVVVRSPELTKFEEELRWMVHVNDLAHRAARVRYQED